LAEEISQQHASVAADLDVVVGVACGEMLSRHDIQGRIFRQRTLHSSVKVFRQDINQA
jgi:hypothetical protein